MKHKTNKRKQMQLNSLPLNLIGFQNSNMIKLQWKIKTLGKWIFFILKVDQIPVVGGVLTQWWKNVILNFKLILNSFELVYIRWALTEKRQSTLAVTMTSQFHFSKVWPIHTKLPFKRPINLTPLTALQQLQRKSQKNLRKISNQR